MFLFGDITPGSLVISRGISVCSQGSTSNFDNIFDRNNFISDSANRFPKYTIY